MAHKDYVRADEARKRKNTRRFEKESVVHDWDFHGRFVRA